MKIVITTDRSKSTRILSNISMFFFGAFATAVFWALLSKYLGQYGIIIGFWLVIILIFLGFQKTQKSTYPRVIVYGILTATIVVTALVLGFFLLLGLSS